MCKNSYLTILVVVVVVNSVGYMYYIYRCADFEQNLNQIYTFLV